MHYNHLHKKTVKRVSTDWRHIQRRDVALCAAGGSAAERSLCGGSGTCLGVLREEPDVWRLQRTVRRGRKRNAGRRYRQQSGILQCAEIIFAGQHTGIKQGGTAGFPVPLGIGGPAFFLRNAVNKAHVV